MSSPSIQIACAVVWNLLAAGPVFGFAALKPVLVKEGVYRHACRPGETSCVDQDLKLNFMFTVAAAVTNVSALPVGFVLDRRGPRFTATIGSIFLAVGALLLANGSSQHFPESIDPYICGYVALAVGGPFVFIPTFQLANVVPQHSGKVLAALTGAFDTSSALFMAYRVVYQNFGNVSLKAFFTGYLLVPLFIIGCQLFIMPRDSYHSIGCTVKLGVEGLDEFGNLPEGVDPSSVLTNEETREEVLHRHMSISTRRSRFSAPLHRVSFVSDGRRRSVLEEVVGQKLQLKSNGVYGVLHGNSVRTQIRSKWFLYALIVTVLCMLRLNYFMATVRSQELYLLKSERRAEQIGSVFDVALPFGGILAIPFIGLLLDTVYTFTVLKVMAFLSITIGVLGLFPSFFLNLLGILLFVVYRPFYYTVLSDYSSKVFGFETFGTVYGLMMSISGILNMLQTVIDRLTHTVFRMDPTPLNALLTASTAMIMVLWLGFIRRYLMTGATDSSDHDQAPNEHTALVGSAIIEEDED